MLNYELRHDDGILVLNPDGPLEAADFTTLANQVDTFLEQHAKLHGVLIHAQSFPGWDDFGAMLAHVKFIKEHLHRIEKVAVVVDCGLANIVPKIANYFVHAQVHHFDFEQENEAWIWLKQISNAQATNTTIA